MTGSSGIVYATLQIVVEIENALGSRQVVVGLVPYRFEEEDAPTGPVIVSGDSKQPFVIGIPVGLEIGADVEHRALDAAQLPQEQRYQHTAQATVAI